MNTDSGISKHLARRMVHLRSDGITREDTQMTEPSHGPWCYQQTDLGFNYRMTDLQAPLGLSQLERLGAFVDCRQMLAARYDQNLADLLLALPWQHPDTYSSRHLDAIRLQPHRTGPGNKQVFEALRTQGVGVNLHYILINLQPYRRASLKPTPHLPEAERYNAEAIRLPLYADLSLADQDRVVAGLEEVLAARKMAA
jgi:dTDP-4-amino-4,6-dideoxygalactose transaminase